MCTSQSEPISPSHLPGSKAVAHIAPGGLIGATTPVHRTPKVEPDFLVLGIAQVLELLVDVWGLWGNELR